MTLRLDRTDKSRCCCQRLIIHRFCNRFSRSMVFWHATARMGWEFAAPPPQANRLLSAGGLSYAYAPAGHTDNQHGRRHRRDKRRRLPAPIAKTNELGSGTDEIVPSRSRGSSAFRSDAVGSPKRVRSVSVALPSVRNASWATSATNRSRNSGYSCSPRDIACKEERAAAHPSSYARRTAVASRSWPDGICVIHCAAEALSWLAQNVRTEVE